MKIIFVCSGNTCRSPFAEGYFNSLSLKGIECVSRGLSVSNMPVSRNSAATAQNYGFDISSHLSKSFKKTDFDADFIITMSDNIRDFLVINGGDIDKIFTLGGGIPDPYGGDLEVYKKALGQIADEIDKLVFGGFFDNIEITDMKKEHIPLIAEIEKENFSLPWSEKSIAESSEKNTVFFVAQKDSVLLGYIGINYCVDEGYVTSIAVKKEYRNKGVATKLIDRAVSFARKAGLSFISLEVRTSNDIAISLYDKMNFKKEGLRKKFYVNPTEDAIIMTKRFERLNLA